MKENQIFNYSRLKRMPLKDQINNFTLYVRFYFWATVWYNYHHIDICIPFEIYTLNFKFWYFSNIMNRPIYLAVELQKFKRIWIYCSNTHKQSGAKKLYHKKMYEHQFYYMSKKSMSILYSNLLYKMGQDCLYIL